LSLKVLVWANGNQTTINDTSPAELAARYSLAQQLASNLIAIDALADAAISRCCP
jgi:hypothetical protein